MAQACNDAQGLQLPPLPPRFPFPMFLRIPVPQAMEGLQQQFLSESSRAHTSSRPSGIIRFAEKLRRPLSAQVSLPGICHGAWKPSSTHCKRVLHVFGCFAAGTSCDCSVPSTTQSARLELSRLSCVARGKLFSLAHVSMFLPVSPFRCLRESTSGSSSSEPELVARSFALTVPSEHFQSLGLGLLEATHWLSLISTARNLRTKPVLQEGS